MTYLSKFIIMTENKSYIDTYIAIYIYIYISDKEINCSVNKKKINSISRKFISYYQREKHTSFKQVTSELKYLTGNQKKKKNLTHPNVSHNSTLSTFHESGVVELINLAPWSVDIK